MYYFDNAATTAQKPEAVARAVYNVLSSGTVGNPSRGAHGYALKAYGIVLQAKDDVKALFHCGPEYDVAFTHNSTAALNMVLKGLIHPGDVVGTQCRPAAALPVGSPRRIPGFHRQRQSRRRLAV